MKFLPRLLVVLWLSALAASAAARQPNIVFILADDIGIDAITSYGADRFKGRTPHLDALAATGARIEQAYAMPTCNPSRCVAMMGRYTFRYGNKPSPLKETSVAKQLKQAGYATGMAGKWRQMSDTPRDWGFDEYITDPTPSGYFWEKSYTKNGQEITTPEPIYYPDVCRDFAVDFFQRHREQPFFFYYPTHLIHNPIVRTPHSKPDTTERAALYDDMVAYLDQEVGALVAALDKLGLRENTLIVFAGDNGTSRSHAAGPMTIGGRPLSGEKATMLEGGSRVPLIANWKGAIKGGGVVKDLVDFSDLFPTFAEVAGAGAPAAALDGRSFAPQLRGEKGTPREWIYVQHNTAPEWYVREQGWKLTHDGKLFDMTDAPFVEKPVPAEGASEAAAAARQRLQAVLAQLSPMAAPLVATGGKPPAVKPDAAKKKKKKKKKPAAQ